MGAPPMYTCSHLETLSLYGHPLPTMTFCCRRVAWPWPLTFQPLHFQLLHQLCDSECDPARCTAASFWSSCYSYCAAHASSHVACHIFVYSLYNFYGSLRRLLGIVYCRAAVSWCLTRGVVMVIFCRSYTLDWRYWSLLCKTRDPTSCTMGTVFFANEYNTIFLENAVFSSGWLYTLIVYICATWKSLWTFVELRFVIPR